MARLRLGDIDLHYTVEGSGPPLLLLHGFTGSLASWDPIRPELATFATTIAVDLLGHGQSSAPADPGRYSVRSATRDLCGLLDALGIERTHLLGYSMGGRLALYAALAAPERLAGLILESASPGIEDAAERARRRASDDALAERIERLGVPAFVAEWEALPLLQLAEHVEGAVRQRLHAQRLRNSAVGLANSLRGMGTGQQPSLWARLPELQMPVVLIAGQRDRRYCTIAERMQAMLPQARLNICQAAGHTVHVDQPRRCIELVRAALQPD